MARNTVVSLGELHRDGYEGTFNIVEPGTLRSVAQNLMLGDEQLPDGALVLVFAIPDVEPETVQAIIRIVQQARLQESGGA